MSDRILLNEAERDRILAAELTGLLHDLGKLRPEFAREKLAQVGNDKYPSNTQRREFERSARISEPHGGILEPARVYPAPATEDWLARILNHAQWAKVLALPADWFPTPPVQAQGLGDPLRQHHAKDKFPQLSFLGDLYTYAADIRDSALDKGAGQTKTGKQHPERAHIADSLGRDREAYNEARLEAAWEQISELLAASLLDFDGSQSVPSLRQTHLERIAAQFRQALGETRRPTNDVTLWHHSYAAASLFKAAVAELTLRKRELGEQLQEAGESALFELDKMGLLRFRLLGIRWDWQGLTEAALQPVVWTALAERRQQAVLDLKHLLEVEQPIGNVLYEDDDGVVLAVPSLDAVTGPGLAESRRFAAELLDPLLPALEQALTPLGVGTSVHLLWSVPRLYLTDYRAVLAPNSGAAGHRLLQIGAATLADLWRKAAQDGGLVQVCPQCGLRPGRAREFALTESTLRQGETDLAATKSYCSTCTEMSSLPARRERRRKTEAWFGVQPRGWDLAKMTEARNAGGNARVALISVFIDGASVLDGQAFITQVARPFDDLSFTDAAPVPESIAAAGDWLQQLLTRLKQADFTPDKAETQVAQILAGDGFWLYVGKQGQPKDGRATGTLAERTRHVAEDFFFREAVPEGLGLVRHDGDRLALFGQRKHASPGRLTRLWDDLRELWRACMAKMGERTDNWLMPISLDARGFRAIVAAGDAQAVLTTLQDELQQRFAKLRGGLAPHISAVAFRHKFPLYVAMDALRRLEARIPEQSWQDWTVTASEMDKAEPLLQLAFATPQGSVQWPVDLSTGDPEQPDLWHPHAICTSRPAGPGRIVHFKDLQVGETIRLRPATFDFAILDGTAERYRLIYDEQGFRPHFIFGHPGRRAYLLEQLPRFFDLTETVRRAWTESQAKTLSGQMIECYETWVRDVPPALREAGREAWLAHCEAILRRYLLVEPRRRALRQGYALSDWQDLLGDIRAHLENGLFFDAMDWLSLLEKTAAPDVKSTSPTPSA